jgi:hypothetical protein
MTNTDYTEQQLLDDLDFVQMKSKHSISIDITMDYNDNTPTDITMAYHDNTREIVVSVGGDGYSSFVIPVSAVKKIKMFCSCFVADEDGAYKFNP